MGFLDKAFKNVFRGARDFINSPAGIATLAIASPFAMSAMSNAGTGTGFLSKLLANNKVKPLLDMATKSPLVTNAAKNAAMNYGIATLTGSENPEKAALYAAASSVPFSFMKANNMAKTFNADNTLTGDKKLNYLDILTGKVNPSTGFDIPGKITEGAMNNVYDTETFSRMGNTPAALNKIPMQGPGIPIQGPPINMDIDAMQYFGRDGSAMEKQLSENPGLAGLIPGLGLENVEIMATLVPQVAGL